jgi:hypothetical protein
MKEMLERLLKLAEEHLPKLTDAYCRYVDTIVKDSEEVRAMNRETEKARKRFFEGATKGKPC